MRIAGDAERARLNATFAELCRIESPSGHERRCSQWVAEQLASLGLEVVRDDAGVEAESDSGNLFTRVGDGERPAILLCAHLDTVPPLAPVEPVLEDGFWSNANPAILGADNKAAVAVLIELARWLSGERGPTGVELLFTISEENGLRGAKAFDTTLLRSPFGYVLDHASPIGDIVLGSPTYDRVLAEFHGRAAHAGIRPEDGRSAIAAAAKAIAAMRLGRLDAETTANVGTISGGTAANVVPERCALEGEVRGGDDARVAEVVTEMIDHLHDAANVGECDLDLTVQREFSGYRTRPTAAPIVTAEAALRRCGYEPRPIFSGGGSDANALQAAGFACTNLANGTEHNHEPTERVSTAALEGMLEVTIALVHEAAKTMESTGSTEP